MRRERLLLLYPPVWRDRYGEEFLATLESAPLRVSVLIDILSGAIDAWLSADVQRAATNGGRTMTASAAKWVKVCRPKRATDVTVRDGLIGAGVMLALSLVFRVLITLALDTGFMQTAGALKDMAFLVPFTLSMPFWLMKGQSWQARTAIVGVTLFLLIAISAFGRVL